MYNRFIMNSCIKHINYVRFLSIVLLGKHWNLNNRVVTENVGTY